MTAGRVTARRVDTAAARFGRCVGRFATLVLLCTTGGIVGVADSEAAGTGPARVTEICRTLTDDANFKVRTQAALVLGKLGDAAAVACLTRSLGDQNRTVRAMSAQALGHIGDGSALDALRVLAKRDPDGFVRTQAEKSIALLSGPAGAGKKAKLYLNFGPFTGGTKTASADSVKVVRDTLQTELSKLPIVTLTPAGDAGKAGGAMAFWIDGNVTRLDDSTVTGASETSCGVRVMVARWPSKSIISWTSAEASVQSGLRQRDRENARRECLEATAAQLAEDLAKFLKAQGG
ncbi:MAG: HEAT repeat domain-containing protein [Deltaproteobacteria bacterium]|nr:HEAT repeat domain-containing protein [Deltaproteobacteria bacterium]